MKKTILILFAMSFVASSALCQLKVYSNGNVGVGMTDYNTPPSSSFFVHEGTTGYDVSVVSTQQGIFCESYGLYQNWSTGLYARARCMDANFQCGVRGIAKNEVLSTFGRAYGVMGIAGNSSNGWNFGIYGQLDGARNGAAVYGTSISGENGSCVDGRYAGYFNGAVKITNNLTVSGTVNGSIIGVLLPRPNSYSPVPTDEDSPSLSERLYSLRTSSFYWPSRSEILSTTEICDTATVQPVLEDDIQVDDRVHYGLCEEQLAEAFPELIYKQKDGSTCVNYMELIPVLVQTISELNARVQELEGMTNKSKARSQKSTAELGNAVAVTSSVKNIAYALPKDARDASLVISDTNGRLMKTVALPTTGKHETEVNVDGLQDGIYLYSLVSKGNVLATKKMVVKK